MNDDGWWLENIHRENPVIENKRLILQSELQLAIQDENYEQAAKINKKIKRIK